jgi:hypothetical protein
MSGNYRKEKNCLNCEHDVEAHYCSYCGQPNIELKEPFWGFIAHSIGHYFHFDSKFFHTLIPLLTQPGQVTLDYLAGKRARYIHPISLYIFVSIVYFIIVPHSIEKNDKNAESQSEISHRTKANTVGSFNTKLDTSLNGILPDLAKDELKIAVSVGQFKSLSFPEKQRYVDSLLKYNSSHHSDSLKKVIKRYQNLLNTEQDSTYSSYLIHQKALPEFERDHWLKRMVKKKEFDIQHKQHNGKFDVNEELNKYKPKQYFILMPLLAFFIMVNFRKNHIYYIDHLVFTIHGMTAYFIISIVTQPVQKYIFGLGSILSEVIGFAVFIGIVWYLYKGLKLFYNRSRAVTIRKMLTLMILYTISLTFTEWIVRQAIIYLMG